MRENTDFFSCITNFDSGVPVVTIQYVLASQSAGKWLSTEKYTFDPNSLGITEFERKYVSFVSFTCIFFITLF